MTAFLVVWLFLCLFGAINQGPVGIVVATGVMAVISPFWLAVDSIDAGYDAHCAHSYNDC